MYATSGNDRKLPYTRCDNGFVDLIDSTSLSLSEIYEGPRACGVTPKKKRFLHIEADVNKIFQCQNGQIHMDHVTLYTHQPCIILTPSFCV